LLNACLGGFGSSFKEFKIIILFIFYNDASGFINTLSKPFAVVHSGFGNVDDGGQHPCIVPSGMDFNAAFSCPNIWETNGS
jgi:hypothetical protein